jgi:hypothetical protein
LSENDSRTNEELFAETLKGDYDDDAPWAAIRALRQRNTQRYSNCRQAIAGQQTQRQSIGIRRLEDEDAGYVGQVDNLRAIGNRARAVLMGLEITTTVTCGLR